MHVSNEEVIEALLKDAKKFKSKRELNTNEPQRSKPNVNFLARTLRSVVKTNTHLMRTSKSIVEYKEFKKVQNDDAKWSKRNEKYRKTRDNRKELTPGKLSHSFKSRGSATTKIDEKSRTLLKGVHEKDHKKSTKAKTHKK